MLFKNLITNSDNILLIFLRQLFAIYKLAFSEISIEKHLREEMWMTPGEQPCSYQFLICNLKVQFSDMLVHTVKAERNEFEKKQSTFTLCWSSELLLNFWKGKVVVNKVHFKRPIYFSKVEKESVFNWNTSDSKCHLSKYTRECFSSLQSHKSPEMMPW